MRAKSIAMAVARLTPAMMLYRGKRVVRDRFAPLFPDWSMRALKSATDAFPSPSRLDGIPTELASFIGQYYAAGADELDAAVQSTFTHGGVSISFSSFANIDWYATADNESTHYMWRMKMAQLEIVHALLAADRPEYDRAAESLLKSAYRASTFEDPRVFSTLWAPYGVSHRLLALLSGARVRTATGSPLPQSLRAIIEQFTRRDAAFLRRNIEHDLRNNHTERNLAALMLYFLTCDERSEEERRRLWPQVTRIVRSTVMADGCQVERSAMYQGLTIMSLEIFAVAAVGDDAKTEMREQSRRAQAALRFMQHADGEIMLFNDSWIGETPSPDVIAPAAAGDDANSNFIGGYWRRKFGQFDVFMDCGPIGPPWNPGHGHADFLSTEIDVQGIRFIVDPGTSGYSNDDNRNYQRAAASHNGPSFAGAEPIEFAGSFRVGKLASASPIPERAGAKGIGGTFKCSTYETRRTISGDGSRLVVSDHWRSAAESPQTVLLIPGNWALQHQSQNSILFTTGDVETTIEADGAQIIVDAAIWSSHYGKSRHAHRLTLTPVRHTTGHALLEWNISTRPRA